MIYCYYYCFSIASGNDLQWFIVIIIVISALWAETICNGLIFITTQGSSQPGTEPHSLPTNPFQKLSTILLSGGGTKPAVCKIKHFFYVTFTLSWNSCFGYVVIYSCKINVIFNRLIHYSMPFLSKLLHIFFSNI